MLISSVLRLPHGWYFYRHEGRWCWIRRMCASTGAASNFWPCSNRRIPPRAFRRRAIRFSRPTSCTGCWPGLAWSENPTRHFLEVGAGGLSRTVEPGSARVPHHNRRCAEGVACQPCRIPRQFPDDDGHLPGRAPGHRRGNRALHEIPSRAFGPHPEPVDGKRAAALSHERADAGGKRSLPEDFRKKFRSGPAREEWFGLAAVTALGNYLTPLSGGLVARAAYLKRRHNFPYAHFLAMLAANYMIAFAVIGVTGIVTLLTLTGTERVSWPVLLFFLATLSMIPLVLLVPSTFIGSRHRWLLFVNHAMEGLHAIRRDGALLGKLIATTFFNITVGALLLFVAFASTGFPIPFSVALLIFLLTSYTVLINITPGNLGVQEVVTSLAAAILGAGADAGCSRRWLSGPWRFSLRLPSVRSSATCCRKNSWRRQRRAAGPEEFP